MCTQFMLCQAFGSTIAYAHTLVCLPMVNFAAANTILERISRAHKPLPRGSVPREHHISIPMWLCDFILACVCRCQLGTWLGSLSWACFGRKLSVSGKVYYCSHLDKSNNKCYFNAVIMRPHSAHSLRTIQFRFEPKAFRGLLFVMRRIWFDFDGEHRRWATSIHSGRKHSVNSRVYGQLVYNPMSGREMLVSNECKLQRERCRGVTDGAGRRAQAIEPTNSLFVC